MRERYPDSRFLFVGEGRLRRGFQKFVERQGWQDVILAGYVPDKDLPRYFASAHVFCSPATGGESRGIVLLEAMASAVPVVASNISGYATVINQGMDGLLTAPRNGEELALAVKYLLEHEPFRQQFIHAGLQKTREYAWPHVAQRVLDFYYHLPQKQDKSSFKPQTHPLLSSSLQPLKT